MNFPDFTGSFFSGESKIVQECFCFLTENNIIYGLQFGLRQTFSTSHVLINPTGNRRHNLDERYIGCE